MNPFILSPQKEKMWVDNGKVVYSPIEDEYREGLAYVNKLYEEGLIYPESFTQDKNAQVNINEGGEDTVIGAFLAQRPGYANDYLRYLIAKKWSNMNHLHLLKVLME